jgi:hypothetical protein
MQTTNFKIDKNKFILLLTQNGAYLRFFSALLGYGENANSLLQLLHKEEENECERKGKR